MKPNQLLPVMLLCNAPDVYMRSLKRAAELLLRGELVAFPTETVYGLGAVIDPPGAVERIFMAKGRPQSNPVIVHVQDFAQAVEWAWEIPEAAHMLAERFWPGPLTMVLRRNGRVADVITAGQDWVGLRCPDHPVAMDLLRQVGIPLAAPSANRSEHISPTCAEHVVRSLGGRVAAVLDGGCCPGGLESTVVRVADSRIEILRPGPVTRADIEALGLTVTSGERDVPSAVSQGQAVRHYAPDTRVRIIRDLTVELPGWKELGNTGFIILSDLPHLTAHPHCIQMPVDGAGYGRRLYDALHELDRLELDEIVIEEPPRNDGIWAAIHDRLRRCAG